ncbi:MAG: serine acetyltransferase, partial [Akkermansiaceae bacterium]|nr:serine acetyltransferase [Akkermansiaceae bacterium]
MSLIGDLLDDVGANQGDLKGQLMVVSFRLAAWFRRNLAWTFPLGLPYLVVYRIVVEWILGVELPPATRVGRRLHIHHGQGLVVNNLTVLGDDCRLRHGVTIGNKSDATRDECPRLGARVDVGAHAVILGGITIGDDAVIGAGAVVLKDVPEGGVAVGNPATVIKTLAAEEREAAAAPANRGAAGARLALILLFIGAVLIGPVVAAFVGGMWLAGERADTARDTRRGFEAPHVVRPDT